MPKFIVQHPVQHDGDAFKPGSFITLSEREAAPLRAVGAILTESEANEVKIHNDSVLGTAADLEAARAEIAALRERLAAAEAPATDTTKKA